VEPFGVVWRMAFSSAAASFVNGDRTRTWLSKSMTSAWSSLCICLANPIAASCAIPIRSSMLALVSRSSAREIGCCVREKNVSFCFAPSS
jgi:hypothetical protein